MAGLNATNGETMNDLVRGGRFIILALEQKTSDLCVPINNMEHHGMIRPEHVCILLKESSCVQPTEK